MDYLGFQTIIKSDINVVVLTVNNKFPYLQCTDIVINTSI